MHAEQQSGGRSSKQLNTPSSTPQLKSGSDIVQNNGSSFTSQAKGKKRDRSDSGTELIKCERDHSVKAEDGDFVSFKFDNMKAEIAKMTETGSLVSFESVEKLVNLMFLDRAERKIDLANRVMLLDIIAATENEDCLGKFVMLRGVTILDDWLQEAHKGKTGDGSSPKESDKTTEELLLALLRALNKLPVNLNALQTCNIGKSVNHLRGHKNMEIQKKARCLVDTWKKRVDAEMKNSEVKSAGSGHPIAWPGKPGFTEVSHAGNRRAGLTEVSAKSSTTQSPGTNSLPSKPGLADAVMKSASVAFGTLKMQSSLGASVGSNSKELVCRQTGGNVNAELPVAAVKEEKSSSLTQSQNSQSCSGDPTKTTSSLWKDDARSSTVGRLHVSKTLGSSSRHRRSSNGLPGANIYVTHKETSISKSVSANDQSDRKLKLSDALQPHIPADANVESWKSNYVKGLVVSDEGDGSPGVLDDEHSRTADESEKVADPTRNACLFSGIERGDALTETKVTNSLCSINALVESCAKYSEGSASLADGDDNGMDLLASVAAEEISKSESSLSGSQRKEEPCSDNNEIKPRLSCADSVVVHNLVKSDEISNLDVWKHEQIDENLGRKDIQQAGPNVSGDNKKNFPLQESAVTESAERSPISHPNPDRGVDACMKSVGNNEAYVSKGFHLSGPGNMKERLDQDMRHSSGQAFDSYIDYKPTERNPSANLDRCVDVACKKVGEGSPEVVCNALGNGLDNSDPNETSEEMAVQGSPSSTTEKVVNAATTIDRQKHSEALVAEDVTAKLDFDLNEGISGDDGHQCELAASAAPMCSSGIHFPSLSPLMPPMSTGYSAPITVAAPAKGPFVPLEKLSKIKGEPGWKGSAATSAFRPAEPRKILEMPHSISDVLASDAVGKPGHSPLDIDLNVPDERVFEEMASQRSAQTTVSMLGISNHHASARAAEGLDLDLNRVEESTENGQFSVSSFRRLEASLLPVRSPSTGFAKAEGSTLRDFDLNGPGADEVNTEAATKSQVVKSTTSLPIFPPAAGLRTKNHAIGNPSSWFSPANSYPAVAIPPFLPDGGEQAYPIVAASGAQRVFGSVTGISAFGSDIYRGPVLSSSPAMAFPPAAAFPYAGFPFNSSFPLASASFSSGSTSYVDSLSVGAPGYPAIPSQLVGSAGAVSSHYPRPCYISLPEGSSSIGPENSRIWVRHGLDLNCGPGGTDIEGKDEKLPAASRQVLVTTSQAFAGEQARAYQAEQARIYQASVGGIKRKEPEGGWEAGRSSYKQHSWQ